MKKKIKLHIKEQQIRKRVFEEANHILQNETTIRGLAQIFGCSKSTCCRDMRVVLKELDYGLYLRVREVTEKNKRESTMRGGIATHNKYNPDNKI